MRTLIFTLSEMEPQEDSEQESNMMKITFEKDSTEGGKKDA